VTTLRDLEEQRSRTSFLGRDEELTALLGILEEGGPLVVFVHGIAGIGKSSLLAAFAAAARERGATVLQIDCASIEPTHRGFLAELSRVIGGDAKASPLEKLAGLASKVVIAVDTYEAFRISDQWIRQSFLPQVPGSVRVVIAGREPPSLAWFGSLGWSGGLSVQELGPLDEASAIEILRSAGLSTNAATRVNRVARGYPLALRLAAAGRVTMSTEDVAARRAVDELAATYLSQADPGTRTALEAASVVRRVTPSLLGAMVPDLPSQDAYERLAALPFIRTGPDGLDVHLTLKEAIAGLLRSQDAERHRRYRQAAWAHLLDRARSISGPELWRYTAGMLYLIENPIVREAFFPAGSHVLTVEESRPEDRPAILETIARHEGRESAKIMQAWLEAAPRTFRVVRDWEGAVSGFYQILSSDALPARAARMDPVIGAWQRHLALDPVAREDLVLFSRRALDRERGEEPGPVQAATFLDVKRQYMELRPRLRRLYSGGYAERDLLPALGPLGFVGLPEADLMLDGLPFRTIMLDFGPGSVDEWLARVAAKELGLAQEDLLDLDARELVIDHQRTPLTRLEFDLLRYLVLREGKVVPRTDLLADVWGYSYQGDSNVIEVAVRSLRRKLGRRADLIETVRGVGYRYRRDGPRPGSARSPSR
jgi:hypothetical protein